MKTDLPQPASRHSTAVPGRAGKALMGSLVLLVIGHSFLIALWAMPDNPVREATGQDRLEDYANPWFAQSWSVFAPTPRRVDESFAIRAVRTDPRTGEKQVTAWFDITGHDTRRNAYSVNPARMASATHRLAGNINTAIATFNLAQQDLVQKDMVDPSKPALKKALLDPAVGPAPAKPAVISSYVRNDAMIVRFATMYASARWGGGIEQIQYRLGRRVVPPYASRDRTEFAEVQGEVKTFGWRKALAGTRDAQAGFDAYVDGDRR